MLYKLVNFLKRYYPQFIIASYILILLFVWFREGKIYAFGEEGPSFIAVIGQRELFFNTLLLNIEGTIHLPRLLSGLYLDFMRYINVESYLSQLILFFFLMSLGCIYIYKICIELIFEDSKYKITTGLIASSLYLFNPYSIAIWSRGLLPLYFNFALIPIVIYYLSKTLKERDLSNLYWLYIYLIILSTSFAMPANIILIFLTSFVLVISFSNVNLIFKIKSFILFIIGFSIVNLWWLIPLTYTSLFSDHSNHLTQAFEEAEKNLNSLRTISKETSFEYVIRLSTKSSFITNQEEFRNFYLKKVIDLITYFYPFLVLLFLLLSKRVSKYQHLISLLFVGLFFSLGTNEPLGVLLIFLLEKIQTLQVFRNPFEKVGIIFLIPYIIFMSNSIVWFFNKNKSKFFLGVGITIFFLSISIYFIFKNLEGKTFFIPSSIETLNEKLIEVTKLDERNRVLFLPYTGEGVKTSWGYQGYNNLNFFFQNEYYTFIPNTNFKTEFDLYQKLLNQENVIKQAEKLKIGYIVLRKDILNFEQSFYELEEKIYSESKICNSIEIKRNTIICTYKDLIDLSDTKFISMSSPNNFIRKLSILDENNNRINFDKFINLENNYIFTLNKKNEDVNLSKIKNITIHSESNLDLTIGSNKLIFKNTNKNSKLNLYEKIWENEIGTIYKILNLKDIKNPELFEITSKNEVSNNFYYVENSPSNIVLNYNLNRNWKLIEYNLNNNQIGFYDFISLYKLAKNNSNIKQNENFEEYYKNTWKVEPGKNYVIFYYQELLKVIGVYLSIFFVLVSLLIISFLKFKKINDSKSKIPNAKEII
jgi:hypothetical protein